jgi:small conductance mechanosensitive channel
MAEIFSQDSLSLWLSKAVTIAVILLLSYLGYRLFRTVTRRLLDRVMDDDGIIQLEARRQQKATLVRLVSRTGAIFIAIIAGLTILAEMGLSVTPLLTGAGVLGVAVGLGTQNLIKDMVAGAFIVVEDQFAIGDVVTVAGVTGTVESMSLRSTKVREVDGTLHVVPNSEITVATNMSKDWARAVVNVGVAYETDITNALSVLQDVGAELAAEPQYRGSVLEPPQAEGVMDLADSYVTLRAMIKVKPDVRWGLERQLRKRIKERFEKEGIDMPYPQQVVHLRQG